jgi:putative membrane protein
MITVIQYVNGVYTISFQLVLKEQCFMSNSKKKKAKVIGKAAVIIGVLIIPLLYSFFYLEAFWDPYARLEDVPVAVVNLDEGATINGVERNVGTEICDTLKEDGSLKFVFTNENDAKNGVLNQDYYASITIPENFSSNISTVSSDTEKIHSEIIYSANQKKNYLAAQILENAMPTIKETVNASIDKEIIQTLSDKLESVPDQLGELQDGLGQLYDGSEQLADGTDELDSGADDLKSGSSALYDGTSQVSDGAVQLNKGLLALDSGVGSLVSSVPTLANGVSSLNGGAQQIKIGSDNLSSGIKDYTDGVSTASSGASAVKDGVSQYTSGVASASSGATALYQGVKKASDGVNQITSQVESSVNSLDESASEDNLKAIDTGSETLSNGLATLNQNYSQAMGAVKQYLALYYQTGNENYLTQAQSYIDNVGNSISQLSAGAAQLNQGTSKLTDGMRSVKTNTKTLLGGLQTLQAGFGTQSDSTTLLGGAYQLSVGLDTINSNSEALNSGISQLNSGLSTLVSNNTKLTTGASDLADGAAQLADGTQTLNDKVPALSDGATALADGTAKLLNGSTALSDGATQVTDGSKQLYNGILTLKSGTQQLSDGAYQLKDGLVTAKDGVDDSVADTNEQLKVLDGLADYSQEPVSTSTEYVQPVENYGSAFAPYFMGLSLWVGGLMIYFGIYLDYTKKIGRLTKDSDNKLVRGLSFIGISAAQGICLALVIKYALGIVVNNLGLLFAACVLTSLTFMMIIQFFIMYTGSIGKFISLFLLILQLTSCAGTFPIETQSNFFVVINKFLPMTYSTQLFKEAISGTSGDWAGKNALVLLGFLALFIVLNLIGLYVEKTKNINKKMAQIATA